MCGICGICNFNDRAISAETLDQMRDMMITRGPDAAGSHIEDHLGLGHRRLAIIDLTPSGRQPMSNETDDIFVAFNGEIYNFQPIRQELLDAGHQFKSQSDTEILLHGYEEWGIDELTRRIRGMFAFALWDRNRKSLYLVRDHLGKKPLFYYHKPGEIWFSSDIKSIWQEHGDQLHIQPEAIDELFYYYFITQGRSVFREIHKLEPGHLLEFSQSGLQKRQYWKPDYSQKQERSTEEWLEEFDVLFRQSVRRRMISDVPLGAFLSGGLDSSTVCAVMAEESENKIKTFCAGYGEKTPLDERLYAKQVADIIGSEHIELEINPDVASELSRIVWHYGEPFADSSAIPSYLIAREARKHVTVVLTGDGGDEAFAGYPRYLSAQRADRHKSVAFKTGVTLLNLAAQGLVRLAPASYRARRLENLHSYLSGSPAAHARFLSIWDGFRAELHGEKMAACADFHPVEAQRDILDSLTGHTSVDHALEYVLRQRLPSDYLTKVDVATMAHSLEARSPFLDVDLMEFAMKMPASELLKNGKGKALVKRYLERWLPSDLINRKKAGFEIPVADWFRSRWYPGVRHLIVDGVAAQQGYIEPKAAGWLIDQHLSGKPYGNQIWTLLVFEIWLRLFIEKSLKPGDPVF